MDPLYRRFKVALRSRDADAIRSLVRDHPAAHGACERGDLPIRQIAAAGYDLLLAAFEAGLSPDADDDPFPAQTFLQAVAADGDGKAVALCIRFGAQLERRNHSGETALGYACSWGHLSVVKLLVEAGADINAVEHDPEDDVRNTALDSAMKHPDVVDYLRGIGAKRIVELGDG